MNQDKNNKYSIAQLGNAVLRQRAAEVENILADECQLLINQMMLAVSAVGGVGIAAP